MLCVTTRMLFAGNAPALPQVADFPAQIFSREHVESAEGFIHHQDIGFHHKRPREADPLAHASRELLRISAFKTFEAHHAKRVFGFLFTGWLGNSSSEEAEFGVFLHGEPRQQGEALKNHRDIRVRTFQRSAFRQNPSVARLDQAGQDAQKGALTGTASSQQRDDFPGRDAQCHFFKDGLLASRGQRERLRNFFSNQQVFHSKSSQTVFAFSQVKQRLPQQAVHTYDKQAHQPDTQDNPGPVAFSRRFGDIRSEPVRFERCVAPGHQL